MEQMPQYRTKLCRYGTACRNLLRGNCTFAHSTADMRTYFNPWVNAKYSVLILVDNDIATHTSFEYKSGAVQAFKELIASRSGSTPVNTKCKDSFLFVKYDTDAVVLIGLPKQDNREVWKNCGAAPAGDTDATLHDGDDADFGEAGRGAARAGAQGDETV
jgi:hypothetical protein